MNSTEYEKYYDEMCLKHNNMLDFNFFEEDFSEISFLEKAIYYEDLSFLDNDNLSFNVNMRLVYPPKIIPLERRVFLLIN